MHRGRRDRPGRGGRRRRKWTRSDGGRRFGTTLAYACGCRTKPGESATLPFRVSGSVVLELPVSVAGELDGNVVPVLAFGSPAEVADRALDEFWIPAI